MHQLRACETQESDSVIEKWIISVEGFGMTLQRSMAEAINGTVPVCAPVGRRAV